MKRHLMFGRLLLFILIIISLNGFSQDRMFSNDKIYHITGSSILTISTINLSYKLKIKNPEIIGISSTFLIGLSKELIYDKKFSSKDIIANSVGIITGYYLNKLIHKNKNKKYEY